MLRERRAFSVDTGHIQDVARMVVATPRDDEAVIIFNDMVVPVLVDDDEAAVLARWHAKQAKAAG